mmetsp:Transcript_105095/g.208923  ORF Transcript_105095/g.208923 Transcript_105095/m.208923 type:complete len:108 (+) Transcript_105095:50-373(+)
MHSHKYGYFFHPKNRLAHAEAKLQEALHTSGWGVDHVNGGHLRLRLNCNIITMRLFTATLTSLSNITLLAWSGRDHLSSATEYHTREATAVTQTCNNELDDQDLVDK